MNLKTKYAMTNENMGDVDNLCFSCPEIKYALIYFL